MKQKEMARWLKFVTLLAGAAGVCTVVFLIPELLNRLIPDDVCAAILWLPLVLFCWVTSLPCFACLWQFWGICTRIGQDRSFCPENAAALKRISQLLFIDCILYFFLGVAVALLGLLTLTVWPILLIGTILLIGLTLTVLSAALSHLILKASALQLESNLTI